MRSVEEIHPRPGLSVPVITVLDADGRLVEDEQRAVVRHVIQEGYGADVVFAAGTTGEWDRIPAEESRRAIRISVEEVAKQNATLGSHERGVEAWAGITAHTARETLENLDFCIASGAHAAVLAPLSIRGLDDPVRFVARDVADLLDARSRRIPVFLYDNADIAADPRVPHIRTRQVKALSRLDFVRGIKVSAPRKVLGNYTKAAAHFRDRGDFGIYVGDAMLIFEIFKPRRGWLGSVSERWQRWRLSGGMPIGVVAGPANALPREWARAWQVCRAGDGERMERVRSVLERYRAATRVTGGKRSVACLKRSLRCLGVVENDAVAEGTPALTAEEAERFDAAFAEVRALSAELLIPTWVTPALAREPAPVKAPGAVEVAS